MVAAVLSFFQFIAASASLGDLIPYKGALALQLIVGAAGMSAASFYRATPVPPQSADRSEMTTPQGVAHADPGRVPFVSQRPPDSETPPAATQTDSGSFRE